MKKLAFLILALPCLQASAQTPQRLLWYKGKKQNDSTLVTASGAIITYRKKTSEVEVKQKTDKFAPLIAEIQKTEERKKEMLTAMAKHKQGVILYTYTKQVLDTYDKVASEYKELISPKMPLPAASSLPVAYISTDPLLVSRGPMNLFANEFEIPQWVKNNHADVLKWVSQHPIKKDNAFDLTYPPVMNIACYGCDEESTKEYDATVQKYIIDFAREETEMINKAFAVSVYGEKLSSKTEIQPLIDDLIPAQIYIIEYLVAKATALANKWGNDVGVLSVIIKTLIQAERQNQLLGGKDTYSNTIALVLKLLDKEVVLKYFNKAVKEHDYPVILNLANWIALERQRQLLGTDDDNSAVLEMETILQYNRFRFTHSYDIKWKGDCCQIRTVLEADEIFLIAVPLKGCKYIFLADSGQRTSVLLANHIVVNVKLATRPDGQYLGPDKYTSHYPVIRADFCNEIAEIKLSPKLSTFESQHERWTPSPPGYEGPGGQDIKITMERSFPWTDKSDETDRERNIVKLVADPGVIDLKSMETAYLDAKAVADFEEYPFFLQIKLANKALILFNDSLDGKEGNDAKDDGDGWADIEWSWARLKLEHAPLLKK